MLGEYRQVKKFFGAKFGYAEPVPDGVYAVPTTTSKGNAFMRIEMKDGQTVGDKNFKLYWDEQLTASWYDTNKPEGLKESSFAKLFRKLEKAA